MSTVTYRGVDYNTEQSHQVQPTEGEFTYRGRHYTRLNELHLIREQAVRDLRRKEAQLASARR